MATVHQRSVIRNSCVKTPINPQTGLSYTSNERPPSQESYLINSNTLEFENDRGNMSEFHATEDRSVNFDTTHFETMHDELNSMTDDAFYQRLIQLKEDHKKTLELCENLYTEKLETQRRTRSRSPSPAFHTRTRTRSPSPASHSALNRSHDYVHSNGFKVRDFVRDMSSTSKPPIPQKSAGTPKQRPSSASAAGRRSRQARTSKECSLSGDEDFWRAKSVEGSDLDVSARKSHQKSHNDSLQSSMSRIEDMWENFSVDEYAPHRSMRHRSNSLSRLSDTLYMDKDFVQENFDQKWKHRITIPKPFSMTVRDSLKSPTKSKAMIELEEKREAERIEEEEECQKKFKAKPVPAHIYMPLYDEIMEKQEAKRRYNRQQSAELLKSQQKPFEFATREEEKKKRIQKSAAVFKDLDETPKKEFKARPYPDKLFKNSANSRLQEEEEYRQIRIQIRAQEMLKSASLPPNMAARGKDYIDGKSRQKIYADRAKKAGITVEHKFKPRVNDDVPDFDDLHRRFLSELGSRKGEREATVCKPFNLRTSRIPSTKQKIYEDMLRDEETLRESRWPYKSSRARTYSREDTGLSGMSKVLSTSMDSIPAKTTAAAQLRASANKSKMQQQIEAEIRELESERRRRLKEKQLQRTITEKALANDQTADLKQHQAQKLQQYRESERERQEEYRRYLNEVQERVQQRPLLFERTTQENARRQAEKKYQETIQRAGISEDFIQTRGRGEVEDLDEDDPNSFSHSLHHSGRSYSSARSASRSPRSYSKSAGTGKYSEDFEESRHTADEGSDLDMDDA